MVTKEGSGNLAVIIIVLRAYPSDLLVLPIKPSSEFSYARPKTHAGA